MLPREGRGPRTKLSGTWAFGDWTWKEKKLEGGRQSVIEKSQKRKERQNKTSLGLPSQCPLKKEGTPPSCFLTCGVDLAQTQRQPAAECREPIGLGKSTHQSTLGHSRYTLKQCQCHFPCHSSASCWAHRATQSPGHGQGVTSGADAYRPLEDGSHLEAGRGSGITSQIPVVISCGFFFFFSIFPCRCP